MLPDQGCYEERYRVTGAAVRSLAIGLIPLIPVVLSSHPVLWLILIPILGALAAVPPLLAVATHKIAFRADMAGITLGSDPLRWPRSQADVYIPWSDVTGIVIYRRGGPSGVGQSGPWIGIQRRADAPPLPRGNKPARRCPVPGVAAGATRAVATWRLDRDRLAAIAALAAPAVPIIDASTGQKPSIEGPGQIDRPTHLP